MAKPVKYKKPRLINPVSVTLVLLLAFGGYALMQFAPLWMLRAEAYSLLEETGSVFAGHRGLYSDNPRKREELRKKLEGDLRRIGVEDTRMESWIEMDGPDVRIGCLYSMWVEWPFDVVAKTEHVYELEHRVTP